MSLGLIIIVGYLMTQERLIKLNIKTIGLSMDVILNGIINQIVYNMMKNISQN